MHAQRPKWNSQIFPLVVTMIRKKVYSLFFTSFLHWSRLPTSFDKIRTVYNYCLPLNGNILSQTSFLALVNELMELNYGKFNIRFAAVKVWNHLDESIKHLPLKTFKNKVKLNILQSYCSWFFNWSLLLFLFSLSYFSFFFLSSFFLPIICFAQALVPTYVLYLNIIYFYSTRLAFQLFWVNVTFFCINILCV